MVTIPYGSDLSAFTPSDAPRTDGIFRIVFVGQITQRKGIKHLLEAFKQFRGPNTELVLAGRFIGAEQACKPYESLYRYVGHLSKPQLVDLYRSADVLVLPTLIDGLGLVVLDAMACGIPVIVSPNGPAEVVRDGIDGFVVPIRDPAAIVDRLHTLRSDPELRRQMGERARARALEFSWAVYRKRAGDFIQGLLNGTRSPQ